MQAIFILKIWQFLFFLLPTESEDGEQLQKKKLLNQQIINKFVALHVHATVIGILKVLAHRE